MSLQPTGTTQATSARGTEIRPHSKQRPRIGAGPQTFLCRPKQQLSF